MSHVIAFDTETHLMRAGNLTPPLVCLSACSCDSDTVLFSTQEAGSLDSLIDILFDTGDDAIRVAHNLAFDLGVLCSHRRDLRSAAFSLLESGRMQCTKVREKLLVFAKCGQVDFLTLPDGSNSKMLYSLADLSRTLLGRDISASKAEGSWRKNYKELERIPVAEWPEEAREYAKDDARLVHAIYENQEARRRTLLAETGVDPFETLNFRCMADFCLWLMTCHGMRVDSEEMAAMERMIADELSPARLSNLIESGILRPASLPRPHVKAPGKMTKEKPESLDMGKLRAEIQRVCEDRGIPIETTPPSSRFPEGQVSTASEFIDTIRTLSPVLTEYSHRQSLMKLVSTDLPRMRWEGKVSEIVHPCYDVLKRSGRTSSQATDTFPSFNCQNVDARARNCFIPREGFLLFSCDYSQMELGTLAQTCLNLFGHSVMADLINKGCDLHSYLGAEIARALCPEFRKVSPADPMDDYSLFMRILKKGAEGFSRGWAEEYRSLAKPTGLGYPGGLGATTFMAFARANYGVDVSLETAEALKAVWLETFPEVGEYFRFINEECFDPDSGLYGYTTPYGMRRINADFCAVANGLGLQSPSAEGAILGVINVVRACADPAMRSILLDSVRPICFVHDEIIGEVRDDDGREEALVEVSRLMTESMRVVTPDVASRVDFCLMSRWDNRAKATYENGKLVPWRPPCTNSVN